MQNKLGKKRSEIFASIWSNLENATKDRNHPWRYVQLSTLEDNHVFARTVVVRNVSRKDRSIECHTDYRSAKIQHIQHNPNVVLLAFDPISKVQIICYAQAIIHYKTPLTESRWLDNHTKNQLNYANKYTPGSRLKTFAQLQENNMTSERFNSESAYNNFAVIESKVHQVDYLLLKNTAHIRAQFNFQDGVWASNWIAP